MTDNTNRKMFIGIFSTIVFIILLFVFKLAFDMGELSTFIVSAIGGVAFFRFVDKKFTPKPEPEKEEEPTLYPGHGIYVIEFIDRLFKNNTATIRDITKALGSSHPLEMGAAEYWSDYIHEDDDPFRWAKESININHFDGHLAIGGNLYWDGLGHMLTNGSARSGKGSCLIVPALISRSNYFPGACSFICLDPKGENLAIAGRYLKLCHYKVICINPFSIPEIIKFGQESFNVFETFTSDYPDFDNYADMISNALTPPVKGGNDHFRSTARQYISLYIRHMMTQDEEPKNFTTLYRWLRLAGPDRSDFLKNMGQNMAFDGDIAGEALAIFSQIEAKKGSEEVESTYSTIRVATDSFKNLMLRKSISESTFDITTVAKEKTAIFVCMNPSDLEDNQAWLRILFGSFIRSLTKNYNPKRKVAMIMDEFATMGYFKEFEIMSGFMSGYNVTLWPILQSLTQLKSLYPNTWENFVANAIIRHFIRVGDNFTADYVSKRMPIVNKGTDEKPNREPLLRSDEVLTENNIIVLINGVEKPAFFKAKPYWETAYGDSADPNPFR